MNRKYKDEELIKIIKTLENGDKQFFMDYISNEKKSKAGPYAYIYQMSTDAGEEAEIFAENFIFSDVKRIKGEGYDLTFGLNGEHKMGESKLIRLMTKGDGSYLDRSVSILNKKVGYKERGKKIGYYGGLSTTTFQQIKPNKFDWMIGIILYNDGFDLFVISKDKFTKEVMSREDGKCYMSGQHEGNHNEGQTSFNDDVLSKHYVCSVFNDGKDLYLIDRETKEIGEKFNKMRIEDLINEKFNN